MVKHLRLVHKVTLATALCIVACVAGAAESVDVHIAVHKATQARCTYHLRTKYIYFGLIIFYFIPNYFLF